MSEVSRTSSGLRLVRPDDAGRFVDALGHDEVGELVVLREREITGGIFVECGRICWVAAKGRGRHLEELLAVAAGVAPSALSRHYHRCRETKVPLGEDLVARGIVTADALRSALLLHSAECLDLLCAPDTTAQWQPRRRGYSSKFTFSTTELVSRTHALRWPEVVETASSVLATHFRAHAGDWGAALLRLDESPPVAIAVMGAYPEKALDLAHVANISASALEANPHDALHLTIDGDGAQCAFRRNDCLFVGALGGGGPRRLVELRNEHRAGERGAPR